MRFSRTFAWIGGVIIPVLETMRRWSTWQEWPPALFDDYILGGFLLFGAYRTGKDAAAGRPFLVAAWAFACGLGYYSFFAQLEGVLKGDPDPAGVPSEVVLVIKGVSLALALVALVVTLLQKPAEKLVTSDE